MVDGKEHLYFLTYDKNNGLLDETVTAIAQDSKGLLWVGTKSGLLIFDGHTFHPVVMSPTATGYSSVHAKAIRNISFHPISDDVWIRYHGGGLSTYTRATGKWLHRPGTEETHLCHLSNNSTLITQNNEIWHFSNQNFIRLSSDSVRGGINSLVAFENSAYAATDNGIWVYENEVFKPIKFITDKGQDICTKAVEAISITKDGELFFAEEGSIWKKTKSKNKIWEVEFIGNYSGKIFEISWDIYNRMWLGTNNGIVRLDPSGAITCFFTEQEYHDNYGFTRVTHLEHDANGSVWGTFYENGYGLLQYHNDAGTSTILIPDDNLYSLPRYPVNSVFLDDQQTLWIGTTGGGLVRMIKSTMIEQVTQIVDELNEPAAVYSLFNLNNKYLIGTEYGLKQSINNLDSVVAFTIEANVNDMPGKIISKILKIGTNQLVLGFLDQSLALYNTITANISLINTVDSSGVGAFSIRDMLQVNDDIIVASASIGLSAYNLKSGIFRHIPHKDKQAPYWANTLCKDSINERLWIGTRHDGIYFSDYSKGVLSSNHIEQSDTLGEIQMMVWTGEKLLIGSYNGLFLMDSLGSFSQLSTKRVHSLYAINDAEILIGSHDGLYLFHSKARKIKRIFPMDNQPSAAFIERSVFRHNGSVFFGTAESIIKIDPHADLQESNYPLFIAIGQANGDFLDFTTSASKISILSSFLGENESLKTDYNSTQLRIWSLATHTPLQLKYRHPDGKWNILPYDRIVELNNVADPMLINIESSPTYSPKVLRISGYKRPWQKYVSHFWWVVLGLILSLSYYFGIHNRRRLPANGFENKSVLYSLAPFPQQDILRLMKNGVSYTSLIPRESEFMIQVIKHVQDSLNKMDYSVEDLSEQMNLSRTQIFRHIKKETGKSPSEIIKEIRLKEAVALFESNSSLNIAQVAYKVGFKSAAYFSKCFKDYFGVSPTNYIHRK